MAITQIAAFPDEPQHTMTIAWGDKQVRLRLTWRQRLASWYLDIFELDDGEGGDAVAIARGRRVSPRWLPLLGLRPIGLPGDPVLVVDGGVGSDPFPRSELGVSVRKLLIDLADFPATAAAFPDLTVTIAGP